MTTFFLSHVAPGKHLPPRRVSKDLRGARDPEMSRRRGAVGLALLGAGAMAVVSLYQTGLIRHLPEPRVPGVPLDADRVDASDEAYARGNVPDALLGLTSYAITASLAAMGGAGRSSRRPWISLALAGKAVADAVVAAKLTRTQWTQHRAFCAWCLLGAAASAALLPVVAPEARDAVRAIRRKHARG